MKTLSVCLHTGTKMFLFSVTLAAAALCLPETTASTGTFSAVVVEYSPPVDPSLDPLTNLLNNVDNYVDFINLANSLVEADIIVFPEEGLKGYFNARVYLEVPDPKDKVRPCAQNTSYETPLVQLSCAARASATYVVVNLAEQFFNATQQRVLYFNTDVVFDRSGAVIARYRKIHLFGEGELQSPANRELVYFDTDFGVRFGLLTCFDIIFEDPGVVLAKKYNVTHFIFPTAWFSQMPFLTAIQEQYYWAYTLDVVLLASGYNMPSSGSAGSGIYLGRRGPLSYNMSEVGGSFMLHAQLPTGSSGANKIQATSSSQFEVRKYYPTNRGRGSILRTSSQGLKLKREQTLDVYATELITVPDDAQRILNESSVTIPFSIDRTICHNNVCCNFSLEVVLEFGKSAETLRNDDYSQLYYRMAVFDGVRHYDHVATGGLQTCAVLPCVNQDLASCGLGALDSSSKPNKLLKLYQKKFLFKSIRISGNFSNNNSFVGPNVLIGGEFDNFGALLAAEQFDFSVNNVTDTTVVNMFQTKEPISNLVTASVYGRLFFRDGEDYTGQPTEKGSSGFSLCLNFVLVVGLLFISTVVL